MSWIKQDNLHILTVDKYKYSTDQRVSVVFNEPNLEWVLRIKSVTPADAGTYECQVSTKPILSFVVNMKVVGECPVTSEDRESRMGTSEGKTRGNMRKKGERSEITKKRKGKVYRDGN